MHAHMDTHMNLFKSIVFQLGRHSAQTNEKNKTETKTALKDEKTTIIWSHKIAIECCSKEQSGELCVCMEHLCST